MTPGGFLADILSAPQRLATVLEAYEGRGSPLAEVRPMRAVVFLGMGSSRFAALPVAALLRSRGVAAVAELASTELPPAPSRETLAVGVSATGRTPETVDALARHRGTSRTIAVTNEPDSDLADVADLVLPLQAGPEEGGVACLTFQATLAVLHLLAGRVLAAGPTIASLQPAVASAEALRESRARWLPELVELIAAAHTTYAIAPARRLSSALQSALMLREGPRLAADATESGDWLHVDVYLSKRPGYTALLFPGSPFDDSVLAYARERGSTIVAVGTPAESVALSVPILGAGNPLTALLVETGVAELAAAELWRRGLAADDPALRATPR